MPLRLLCLLLLLIARVSALHAQVPPLPLKRILPRVEWQGCPPAGGPAQGAGDAERAEAARLAADANEAAILGDNAAALRLLTTAAGLDPRSERVAYRRAGVLELMDQSEDALAEYCRFLGLAPGGAEVVEVRERIAGLVAARGFTVPRAAADAYVAGIEHFEAGRMTQAEASFGAAASVAPLWPAAVYNRGVARLEQGRTMDAVGDLRRYLELSPGSADFGTVLETVGALQAVAVAPYNPGAALAAGLIVPGLGHFTTGRTTTGALFFGAAAGLAGAGFLVQRSKIDCLAPPVQGRCPPDQVLRETTTRPFLVPALLGAAATGIIGAIDAWRGAQRRNESAAQRRNESAAPRRRAGDGAGLSFGPAAVDAGAHGRVTLVRLRF